MGGMDEMVIRLRRAANGWTIDRYDNLDLDDSGDVPDERFVAGTDEGVVEVLKDMLRKDMLRKKD